MSLRASDGNGWGCGSKRSMRKSKDVLKSINNNNINNNIYLQTTQQKRRSSFHISSNQPTNIS